MYKGMCASVGGFAFPTFPMVMSSTTVESALASAGYDGCVLSALTWTKLSYRPWQDGNKGMGSRELNRSFPSDAFPQYYAVAIQSLCYYDYLLTLPDEVLFTRYQCYKPFNVVQIKYGWKGVNTPSESMDPPRDMCADRTSLLDLYARELVHLDSKSFLTHSQNRYSPILYQAWFFIGSHLPHF